MNVRDTIDCHYPCVGSRVASCSVDGCDAPARARRMCWKHYKRAQRAGTLSPRPTPTERFWSSFVRSESGCWIWTAQKRGRDQEYGLFHLHGDVVAAHRFSYELLVGPIPEGLHIDHLCRTPACVNPAHLEPVVPMENWRRGESPSARAARTGTCHAGHPLKIARWNGGRHYCPTCAAERTRSWRERTSA